MKNENVEIESFLGEVTRVIGCDVEWRHQHECDVKIFPIIAVFHWLSSAQTNFMLFLSSNFYPSTIGILLCESWVLHTVTRRRNNYDKRTNVSL